MLVKYSSFACGKDGAWISHGYNQLNGFILHNYLNGFIVLNCLSGFIVCSIVCGWTNRNEIFLQVFFVCPCVAIWMHSKHQGFQLFVDSYREICIDVYVSKTDGALMWSEASCTVCWSCHSLKSRLWNDDICGQEVHKRNFLNLKQILIHCDLIWKLYSLKMLLNNRFCYVYLKLVWASRMYRIKLICITIYVHGENDAEVRTNLCLTDIIGMTSGPSYQAGFCHICEMLTLI